MKPRKVRPFFARHPWVLDSAVGSVRHAPTDGDTVDLVTERSDFVAKGVYNSRSRLRVRLYTWDPGEPLDATFWESRIDAAVRWRERLGLLGADSAARLIFSEADGVSGLIVDHFGMHVVVQVNALATAARLSDLLPILERRIEPRSMLVRAEPGLEKLEGVAPRTGYYRGERPLEPVVIEEHGVRFAVDASSGQKTGFYLDQRENRFAASRYVRDRRVLDLFCYSGGFGLHALKNGNARSVLGIDGSEPAIALARANAERNGLDGARFERGDAFEALDAFKSSGERFGAIVLDPPKFAKNRFHVDEALRAYYRINRVAVDLLEPDGILVTCSCSGSVSRDDFLGMLAGVAEKSRRPIQILEQRGHAADHPVDLSCPESEYLKCMICRVR
ncbi:MAG: class I SAM-dependent rRNA methyltransferase [Planctomycetes bacterium]|nr:class I SAM-dependent rRNA methyltransferase [Planctomycetota bacterium]